MALKCEFLTCNDHLPIRSPRIGHLETSPCADSFTMLAAIRDLRKNPHLLFVRLPNLLSLVCIVVGVVWLLLLPLNEYSRQTYISENALLPGQVHAYFSGSEQNVFRGYKKELEGLLNEGRDQGVPEAEAGQTPAYVARTACWETMILTMDTASPTRSSRFYKRRD